MQSVKILHSSKHVSLFCVPQAGESGGLSGGRTVPTSHCPEARWQDNPGAAATPSRAAVMRGDRAAISDADGHTGGGKGIPRAALMRNTTITRLPRSIAMAFPSATRGRCVHERDRWFESTSLQRRVTHELCSRRRRKSPKLGWDLFRGAGQGPPERGKRIGPQPQKNQATGSQQDHEDRKGRRIGMKPVEARPAQRRTNADTERKNPKHGPIEFCVITQPEIAAGEERHQVDLGADAEPAGDSAKKRRKPCGTAH